MNPAQIEKDVKENKVKDGMLWKQSRHIKEWKERWMVLTKTHFYSFDAKGKFKDPTEIIALKDVETIKSYYKDQYKKPNTFRIESPDVNLHMSAKSNEEKWAWMTALEKMIERAIHPETKPDTYNLIRETIRMSTGVRQSLQKKEIKETKTSLDFTESLIKKMKVNIDSQTVNELIVPEEVIRNRLNTNISEEEATFFILQKKVSEPIKEEPIKEVVEESPIKVENKTEQNTVLPERVVEKIVERIVEVPVERIVERIVKVPEIKEKIIEKIVYKDNPQSVSSSTLSLILKELIMNPDENQRPLADFIVYLMTSKLEQYHPQVLQFCLDAEPRRFFTEVILLMMNEETDESILNSYLKFVLVIYQNCDEFFYSSDLKALIGILLREMEMNRSEFNQYLIMEVFKSMTEKSWWKGFNYRTDEIRSIVKELEAISGPENQFLASELLERL